MKKNKIKKFIKILLLINIIFFFFISNCFLNNKYIINISEKQISDFNNLKSHFHNNITIHNIHELISNLNKYSKFRKKKYILLFDYFVNPFCNDFNSYMLFSFYKKKNTEEAYYIINNESYLYKNLLRVNKSKNLIPVNSKTNLWNILFPYLLNSKILVHSYAFSDFNKIIDKVNYLKYLKINHGVRFFKKLIGRYELKNINKNKFNTIITSPLEYELYKNIYKLSENNMFKAGLPRYDRFINIKNIYENKCIMISFTYRKFNNSAYLNSLYKKNLDKLLAEKSLISYLKKKKIDLVFFQHHYDTYRNRPFNKSKFPYVKYKNQTNLAHYIEQCSLFVTDFSSISFDFMFQNKPTLFYLIDANDTNDFYEKKYMNYENNKKIYFDNSFYSQKLLIKKIKYYIKRNFVIEKNLKKHYESLFYYKGHITERIINIIENITKGN